MNEIYKKNQIFIAPTKCEGNLYATSKMYNE